MSAKENKQQGEKNFFLQKTGRKKEGKAKQKSPRDQKEKKKGIRGKPKKNYEEL